MDIDSVENIIIKFVEKNNKYDYIRHNVGRSYCVFKISLAGETEDYITIFILEKSEFVIRIGCRYQNVSQINSIESLNEILENFDIVLTDSIKKGYSYVTYNKDDPINCILNKLKNESLSHTETKIRKNSKAISKAEYVFRNGHSIEIDLKNMKTYTTIDNKTIIHENVAQLKHYLHEYVALRLYEWSYDYIRFREWMTQFQSKYFCGRYLSIGYLDFILKGEISCIEYWLSDDKKRKIAYIAFQIRSKPIISTFKYILGMKVKSASYDRWDSDVERDLENRLNITINTSEKSQINTVNRVEEIIPPQNEVIINQHQNYKYSLN